MLDADARREPLPHPRVVIMVGLGFGSRLSVAVNWGWNYLTFERGTRLITGISGSRMEDMPRPQHSPPSAQLMLSVG